MPRQAPGHGLDHEGQDFLFSLQPDRPGVLPAALRRAGQPDRIPTPPSSSTPTVPFWRRSETGTGDRQDRVYYAYGRSGGGDRAGTAWADLGLPELDLFDQFLKTGMGAKPVIMAMRTSCWSS